MLVLNPITLGRFRIQIKTFLFPSNQFHSMSTNHTMEPPRETKEFASIVVRQKGLFTWNIIMDLLPALITISLCLDL